MTSKLSIILEKPIAFHPILARKFGGVNEALFLQQCIYWSDKGTRSDGYFYKKKSEFEKETTLTSYQQDRVRKFLESLGVLETKLVKADGTPTLHYKVNFDVLNLILDYQETSLSNVEKLDNLITENTTENTFTKVKVNSSKKENLNNSDDSITGRAESAKLTPRSAAPPEEMFRQITQKLSESDKTKYLDARKKMFVTRLKTFTFEEIAIAAHNLSKSPWHMGTDPNNTKKYASFDFLMRSDQQVDKWLNASSQVKRFA